MRRGFTLIELLVVIAIIGLLASILVSNLNIARAKSKDARRLSDIHSVMLALNVMYDSEGHYPCLSWHNSTEPLFLDYLVRHRYLASLPKDPKNTLPLGAYTYVSFKGSDGRCGQYYHLEYDVESQTHTVNTQCGLDGGDGRWVAPNHCHFNYPRAIPCSDPYFALDIEAPDCLALQDSNIDI